MYKSIEQRKAEEAERRAAVPDHLRSRLADFASSHGGKYIVYGSLARDAARYDSDIDILVDFPPEHEAEAWRRAEHVCAELDVEADVMPLGWCEDRFLERALTTTKVIP